MNEQTHFCLFKPPAGHAKCTQVFSWVAKNSCFFFHFQVSSSHAELSIEVQFSTGDCNITLIGFLRV